MPQASAVHVAELEAQLAKRQKEVEDAAVTLTDLKGEWQQQQQQHGEETAAASAAMVEKLTVATTQVVEAEYASVCTVLFTLHSMRSTYLHVLCVQHCVHF